MQRYCVAALVSLSATAVYAQSSEGLVYLSSKDAVANGKQFEITFHEIKREPGNSIVEVTGTPEGASPTSMFILRGMCSVAESRGQQYFRAVQLSNKPVRYGVTFPKEAGQTNHEGADVTGKVYSLAECSLLNF